MAESEIERNAALPMSGRELAWTVGVVAVVALGGMWALTRPTLEQLQQRHGLASLQLLQCTQNAFKDCTTQRMTLEKARQRLYDATP